MLLEISFYKNDVNVTETKATVLYVNIFCEKLCDMKGNLYKKG